MFPNNKIKVTDNPDKSSNNLYNVTVALKM